MHQTYTTQFDIYKNIGGLECFGTYLSERWMVGGQGTLEGSRSALLLLAPPCVCTSYGIL
jgi:hypothetical protein